MVRFEIRDLQVFFRSREILKDINLSLSAGEALAVVGESGAGKSTLLRTILGELPDGEYVAGGDMLYEGKSLLIMGRKECRALAGGGIAVLFQQPGRFLNPIRRIEKQFRDFLKAHGVRDKDTHAFAVNALKKAGFERPEQILASYVFHLSGGQKQRVALAMLLSFSPQLILLDEPTATGYRCCAAAFGCHAPRACTRGIHSHGHPSHTRSSLSCRTVSRFAKGAGR